MINRRRSAPLALVLAVSIAASCGGDDSSTDDTTAATTASTAVTTTADVATTAAGPSTSTGTAAPGTTAAESSTRQFEAENGTIEIPADPQRIVACGYAVLPLVQAKADLAGICEWTRELDDMTPEEREFYDSIPKVGPDGRASEINYEAIAAADPDLILLGVPLAFVSDVDVPGLEAMAPVVVMGPVLPGDWRDTNPRFADAAGVGDAYQVFVDEYTTRAAELATKYESLRSLTFGGVCTNCPGDPGTFRRSYASGFPTNLLDDLGFQFPGEPADPDVARHGEWLSLEQLSTNFDGIDVIAYGVDADGTVPDAAAEVVASPLWTSLPAVQSGNVVAFEHYAAATHATAILALDSIDRQLEQLPLYTAS